MKRLLKRLVVLVILAGAGYLIWQQRAKLSPISNNNSRIQGTWYEFKMDRKGFEPYTFEERIIIKDGTEWGSYELRMNTQLDVMVGTQLSEYRLSFPDEDAMVWSVERDGEWVPSVEWRR